MVLFVEIARAGNFSRACERLAMPNATLSRRVAAMERELGVRLFDRSTRHMALTEPAQRFLERCAPLVDEARVAFEALQSAGVTAQGHVRVSMPVDLGTITLGPWLPEFLREHPGITLDLDMSPRFADLRTEPFDLAFRLGPVRGDGLVAQRLGPVEAGLYAAPAYLARFGAPKAAADLKDHRCLHIGAVRRGATWRLIAEGRESAVAVRGTVALNNMSLMRQFAEGGLGIALLPALIAQPAVDAGQLEVVLPGVVPVPWQVYAVTTSRMQPAAVRAFVEFFRQRLRFSDRSARPR
jgi:DNA-binding transcriptional LysR family regulator